MLPGFSVPSTLGKARGSYVSASVGVSGAATSSYSSSVTPYKSMLGYAPQPVSGGGVSPFLSGGSCHPFCSACMPDPASPTGCSQSCINAVCQTSSPSCPGPCKLTCTSGLTSCGVQCVNLETDPKNCGSCGKVCASGYCTNGTCDLCPPGLDPCYDSVSHVQLGCCPPGQCCATGMCTCGGKCCNWVLGDFESCCGDYCANIWDDPNNCGECGKVCPAGPPNSTPTCTTFGLSTQCGWACNSGFTQCGTACANLTVDPKNCGTCGHVCTGGMICQNGICVCPPGETNCGGVCKNLNNDSQNCGTCGHVCTGGMICQNGTCVCPAGQTNCGGICKNLNNDSQNCGACGHACAGGMICQNGTCVCPSGQTNCGGVCKNLNNDSQNCGKCGNACTGGQICVNGGCVCPAPDTLCNGVCVNTNSDPGNCGGCDKVCPSGQSCCGATGGCTNLTVDSKNCGRCGNVCPAGTSCVNGTCICPSPQTNCPGVGCVNTFTDPNHCGNCNTVCPYSNCTGPVCSGGQCQGGLFCGSMTCCDDSGDCGSETMQVFALNQMQAQQCIQPYASANQCSLDSVNPGACPLQ